MGPPSACSPAALGSLLPASWRGSPTAGVLVAALLLAGLLLDSGVARPAAADLAPSGRRGVARRATAAGSTGSASALQLGLGVVTIVTSATVYATVLLCALSGSPPVGLALGILFGLVRALPVLGLARIHDRAALHRRFHRLEHWAPRADRLARATLATAAAALVVAAVGRS